MSISPLIPAAGAAGVFAARAAKSLAGGASFADIFRKADAAQPAASGPAAAPATPSPAAAQSDDPKQLLSNFQELVLKRLSAAGIDISQPIDLRALGQDGVKVGGNHDDWAKIERLFDEDPELRSAFQRVADAFARQNSSDRSRFQLSLAGGKAGVSFD